MIRKNLFLVFGMLCFVIASAQETTKKVIYISGEKTRCEIGNTITSCYKMKPHEDSAWSVFSNEIAGFIWQPAMIHRLEVEETVVNNVRSYKMLRLIESIPTVFNQVEILKNNEWELVSIRLFHNSMPSVRKAKSSIQFFTDSNYATGFSGCNAFTVKASFTDGRINFKDNLSTLKFCQNDTIEKLVFNVLGGASEFYFKGRLLYIGNSNGVLLHYKPKRKIDSLIYELSHPKPYRGNSFKQLEGITYEITLDDLKESRERAYLFITKELTEEESKTMFLKLENMNVNSNIASIRVMGKGGHPDGIYQAEVEFRDGNKEMINIRNVR